MDGDMDEEERKHTVGQSISVLLCSSSSGDDGDREAAEAAIRAYRELLVFVNIDGKPVNNGPNAQFMSPV